MKSKLALNLRVLMVTALYLSSLCIASQQAHADFVVTRAFREDVGTEFERVFLSEVNRNGSTITVGAATEINAPLIDRARVWAMLAFPEHGQLVYGVFDPDNPASLDALHLVNLRTRGAVQQLNPNRADPANEVIIAMASSGTPQSAPSGGSSARVIYVVRNTGTNTDTLYLADTRNPGTATVAASLVAGTKVGDELIISPDGSMAAFSVEAASGQHQVAISFLNQPANATVVYTNNALTEYRPVEFAFNDDSSRLLWIDSGASSQPGPLQSLALAPLDASTRISDGIGSVTQVSAAPLVNERVSEFAIKPGSNGENTSVAYRSFAASSNAPSDTYLANLSAPNTVTKLNDGPADGAVFTTWEDVLWRSNSVLYNATEAFLELADLFTVAESNPGNPTALSLQVPLSTERFNDKAAGVSHFVQSPDNTKTAMIDGDPALSVFVIDQFNIGASQEPFTMTSDRSLIDITDPADRPPVFSPGSDMIAMVIREEISDDTTTENLYVASADNSNSEVAVLSTASPQVFQFLWFDQSAAAAANSTAMAAAVLPASRSGQVGSTVTAFVTLINGGDATAEQCSIDLTSNAPARLAYQTTNPATNAPTGNPNQPVDIPARGAQSFVISITLDGAFDPRDATLAYSCDNAPPVTPLSGLNTLLLSATTTPVPDVIALAATASADGITRLDAGGNGAFSVASVNVGAGSAINVSATSTTGVSLAMCETNPTNGTCVNPSTPTASPVSLTIGANGTPTFSVFASSASPIAADAANNRISVVYRDTAGNVRGQTSVAVQSR